MKHLLICVALLGLTSQPAQAWDQHQLLMPAVWHALPLSAQKAWSESFVVQEVPYAEVAAQFGLNPNAPISSLPPGVLGGQNAVPATATGRAVLEGHAVDEPDDGMDQDLPETQDPKSDRATMGGIQGPTSQGFRHMWFRAGLQWPPRSLGQAWDRARLFADAGDRQFRAGNSPQALRYLAWSMHYLQDLGQPFHAVQVPALSLIPWLEVLKNGLSALIPEATRGIANYHFAFEQWVRKDLEGRTERSGSLSRCLEIQDQFPSPAAPSELARWIHRRSENRATRLGHQLVQAFGGDLRAPGVDVPAGKLVPDYLVRESNPEFAATWKNLRSLTCDALGDSVRVSRALLLWAMRLE